MGTIQDIIESRQRRLEREIKALQNEKFSTHEGLSQRNAEVAQKTIQLKRVKMVQFPFQNGSPVCPDCFILHGREVSAYTTGKGTEDLDVFRCPECKTLIEAPIP